MSIWSRRRRRYFIVFGNLSNGKAISSANLWLSYEGFPSNQFLKRELAKNTIFKPTDVVVENIVEISKADFAQFIATDGEEES